MDNHAKAREHRYLVVLDIESPEPISDAELIDSYSGELWMGTPPGRVVVVATVLSRTAHKADVATIQAHHHADSEV